MCTLLADVIIIPNVFLLLCMNILENIKTNLSTRKITKYSLLSPARSTFILIALNIVTFMLKEKKERHYVINHYLNITCIGDVFQFYIIYAQTNGRRWNLGLCNAKVLAIVMATFWRLINKRNKIYKEKTLATNSRWHM